MKMVKVWFHNVHVCVFYLFFSYEQPYSTSAIEPFLWFSTLKCQSFPSTCLSLTRVITFSLKSPAAFLICSILTNASSATCEFPYQPYSVSSPVLQVLLFRMFHEVSFDNVGSAIVSVEKSD
jgi:hypothetical protein